MEVSERSGHDDAACVGKKKRRAMHSENHLPRGIRIRIVSAWESNRVPRLSEPSHFSNQVETRVFSRLETRRLTGSVSERVNRCRCPPSGLALELKQFRPSSPLRTLLAFTRRRNDNYEMVIASNELCKSSSVKAT